MKSQQSNTSHATLRNIGYVVVFNILWQASIKESETGGHTTSAQGLQRATIEDIINLALSAYTLIDWIAHRAHKGGKIDVKTVLVKMGTNNLEQDFSRLGGHGALNRGRRDFDLTMREVIARCT